MGFQSEVTALGRAVYERESKTDLLKVVGTVVCRTSYRDHRRYSTVDTSDFSCIISLAISILFP